MQVSEMVTSCSQESCAMMWLWQYGLWQIVWTDASAVLHTNLHMHRALVSQMKASTDQQTSQSFIASKTTKQLPFATQGKIDSLWTILVSRWIHRIRAWNKPWPCLVGFVYTIYGLVWTSQILLAANTKPVTKDLVYLNLDFFCD